MKKFFERLALLSVAFRWVCFIISVPLYCVAWLAAVLFGGMLMPVAVIAWLCAWLDKVPQGEARTMVLIGIAACLLGLFLIWFSEETKWGRKLAETTELW